MTQGRGLLVWCRRERGFSEESPALCEFVESFKERNHNYGVNNAFGSTGGFHDQSVKHHFINWIGETPPARKLRLKGRMTPLHIHLSA